MNKYGFFIKKLQLEGNNVKTIDIKFKKGLNVIYGPSDTGKTFIFQCIDYMLGSSKKPKDIPEAKNYSLIKLEIKTFSGEKYLFERSLKGGDFNILDMRTKKSKVLKSDNKGNDESISDMLLRLSNINDKKIRKNAKGETKKLYFQNLKKLFLIDEVQIVTEKSPIISGQYTEETFEKNILKFLLTGEDDSTLIVQLKPKDIQNKTGKLELYNELISQLENELIDIDYKEIDEQLLRLNSAIEIFREQSINLGEELDELDNEKNNLLKEINEDKNRLININEILQRSDILKKQYISDTIRLKANIEIGEALPADNMSTCPVCDNIMSSTLNIEKLVLATKAEIRKTELLLDELNASQQIFIEEKSYIEQKIEDQNKKIQQAIHNIEDELKNKLGESAVQMKAFIDKKEELSRVKTLKEKLDEYIEKRDSIKQIINDNKNTKKDNAYEELSTTLLNPIVTQIKDILLEMKFENIKNMNIGFSEELLDFTIGDKNRKSYGKGYRAILYAVFVISLLEYLRTKDYQIGLAIIDSPLNPYKPDEQKNGNISTDLGSAFYRYLANNINTEQVILIENTPIPKDIKDKVNYKIFTKENGFLPKAFL